MKRNIRVQTRLNAAEYEHLTRAVKRSGLSREAYLRQLISGYIPADIPPPDFHEFMQALYDIQVSYRELIAISDEQGTDTELISKQYGRLTEITGRILSGMLDARRIG